MKCSVSLLFVFIFLSASGLYSQEIVTVSEDSLALGVFAKVEKESEFPGGPGGWRKFLLENLRYPEKAVRRRIQGTVVLQFIVNKEGLIESAEAISGPVMLQKAALELIRKSPKWIPAEQSGKKVKSYKKQPILFRLS
jgi:protein TonB